MHRLVDVPGMVENGKGLLKATLKRGIKNSKRVSLYSTCPGDCIILPGGLVVVLLMRQTRHRIDRCINIHSMANHDQTEFVAQLLCLCFELFGCGAGRQSFKNLNMLGNKFKSK